MAFTFVGSLSVAADNTTLYDAGPSEVQFAGVVAGMVTGDWIEIIEHRRGLEAVGLNKKGGQPLVAAGSLRQSGSTSAQVFVGQYNGTWDMANLPSATSVNSANRCISLIMNVFRPTAGGNSITTDQAESFHTFSGPVSPGDVTATGRTAIAASTLTVAHWCSTGSNQWANQSSGSGWTAVGYTQIRDPDPNTSRPISTSTLYKVLSSAGATGSPVNRETTNIGANGMWIINTYKEQSTGVTIGSIGDGVFHDGETGLTISCAGAGATKGTGAVIFSPTDNIADGAAVTQSTAGWADTSIPLNAVSLSSFAAFANIYAFVKNNAGASNSSGFIIKREKIMSLSAAQRTLKTIAGATVANATGIRYTLHAPNVAATPFQSSTTMTSDASGIMPIPNYTTVQGGLPADGDDIWIVAALEGASQAASQGTCVKVTPTYS